MTTACLQPVVRSYSKPLWLALLSLLSLFACTHLNHTLSSRHSDRTATLARASHEVSRLMEDHRAVMSRALALPAFEPAESLEPPPSKAMPAARAEFRTTAPRLKLDSEPMSRGQVTFERIRWLLSRGRWHDASQLASRISDAPLHHSGTARRDASVLPDNSLVLESEFERRDGMSIPSVERTDSR